MTFRYVFRVGFGWNRRICVVVASRVYDEEQDGGVEEKAASPVLNGEKDGSKVADVDRKIEQAAVPAQRGYARNEYKVRK
jgi:hypothetical protein